MFTDIFKNVWFSYILAFCLHASCILGYKYSISTVFKALPEWIFQNNSSCGISITWHARLYVHLEISPQTVFGMAVRGSKKSLKGIGECFVSPTQKGLITPGWVSTGCMCIPEQLCCVSAIPPHPLVAQCGTAPSDNLNCNTHEVSR